METPDKTRSQIKQEIEELQKIGEQLVKLRPEQIAQIDMPEALREAVLFAQTITAREALRRQLQYIGRLMREIDPAPIQQALKHKDQFHVIGMQTFHQLEQWRDELINGNESLIQELCQRFPAANAQRLRQFVRNARKEQAQNKPVKSSRVLFRYLRELSGEEVGN